MGVIIDSFEVNHPDYLLFNETAGCFIVEVENEKIAEQLFKGVPYKVLGQTQENAVIDVKNLFCIDVNKLKKVWQEPMRRLFGNV